MFAFSFQNVFEISCRRQFCWLTSEIRVSDVLVTKTYKRRLRHQNVWFTGLCYLVNLILIFILTIELLLQFKNTYWIVNGLSVEDGIPLSHTHTHARNTFRVEK